MPQLQHVGHTLTSRVGLHRCAGPWARRHCSRRLITCASLRGNVHRLLDRSEWLLADPAVQVTAVAAPAPFAVIRDDLLHPLLGGNKLRKLDGLWDPLVAHPGATDVLTCGGLQSAHTLAVAAATAERGLRCHLLVRGERPAVPTAHHLYARMLAHEVTYVSRAEYADRQAMFDGHLRRLQQQPEAEQQPEQQPQQQQQKTLDGTADGAEARASASGPAAAAAAADRRGSSSSASGSQRRVAVIPEGAAAPGALLGLVRLVAWLARHSPLLSVGRHCHVVVDSGTGATATGLALGAALLGLPWRVTGVMLAAPEDYYRQQQQSLTAVFCAEHAAILADGEGAAAGAAAAAEAVQQGVAQRLRWVQRPAPRKFGKVLPGEVAACRTVAQRHGILLDPIWSLAAWEVSCQLAAAAAAAADGGSGSRGAAAGEQGGEQVAMLHTGGMLGLCGLAQRFPDQF